MKRILIFSLVYYPRHIGGAEVAVKEITDRLPAGDFAFDMITLHKSATRFQKVGNVNVHRVGFGWQVGDHAFLSKFKIYKYFFPFFAFAKAVKLHRKNNYDAIWSIMANYAGFGALFFKLFHPRVPFILTLQEGDPLDYIKKRVGILYPLFKMIFKKADKIQAISSFLAEWGKVMETNAQISVIPNGVDLGRFTIHDSRFKHGDKDKIRKELGFSNEDTILVTTSRLVEKNAVGDIIESLQYLPENVKLVIIGVGALESVLKLKAKTLNLEARVNFIGFIAHEELPKYLWSSDIFIRPSRSEGMGNSFIEAMAAGLPVIATPVGGIVDFLKNGETGLFCEVRNPAGIAQKVEKLMKDRESQKYIVENASKMVREKYDWDLVAERMKEEVFCHLPSRI